jgi:hypothetical protein
MRIEAQAAAAKGLPAKGIMDTCSSIVKDSGYAGKIFSCVISRLLKTFLFCFLNIPFRLI